MPYDREKRKQYQKEYYQKNSKKWLQYGREYMKEYRQKNREKILRYQKEYRQKRRAEAIALLGSCCKICGSTEDLHFHQKSCEGHPEVRDTYLLVLKHPEDFILLCNLHHKNEHAVLDLIEQELADI